jgi:hypothetical protein
VRPRRPCQEPLKPKDSPGSRLTAEHSAQDDPKTPKPQNPKTPNNGIRDSIAQRTKPLI